ncbi:uncharacterized protein PV06_05807 [Exophiala oligosperma]|uniref:Ino eighty subunit 1 n=1 Tax=Exophiala oligosperma TaxID=215243 RepID=A0A0D2DGU6_9EURO|nr:uncharacterized protein PV06_05807 [Exophiala oligosperma]KIW42243.1 hypothetical protein PV06_05807 [Exophiala oligosperma]
MTSREPSAAPSDADTIDDQTEETKPDITELEQDQSQQEEDGHSNTTPTSVRRTARSRVSTGRKARPRKSAAWIQEQFQDGTEDEGSVVSASHSRTKKSEASPDSEARTVGTAVGTRRQANGTVGSVYSGSKIRHIKKPDGEPLYRKEIQYQFLTRVTADTKPVFTRLSDSKPGCTFLDIYVDCMARSSKTSKILKDRLQVDRQASQNMAMICLLVNVGRMNTTLNFFPEMRAQLRTYHSIPSLQAYKSQRDYKSLQDAPRLKSILKGASEDTEEPRTLEALKARPIPRTNPVNLIFVLSQSAPTISESHFTDKVDFFDLAMRHTISSESRAQAFLWLMWWYLESNFTKADALNNPYGPGQYKEGEDPADPDTVPLLVPDLVTITPEEGDKENEDPEEEIAFGDKMREERRRIMLEVANEPPLTMVDPGNPDHKAVKRLKRSALYGDDDSLVSDADSRASPGVATPEAHHGHLMSSVLGGQADSLDDDWEVFDPHPGRGRYKRVKGKNTPSRVRGGGAGGKPTDGRKSIAKARDGGTPDTVDRFRGTPQPLQTGAGNHNAIPQYGSHRNRKEIDVLAIRPGEPGASTIPKSRARTGYQRELEEHRQRRVEWALRRRRKEALKTSRQLREGGKWLLTAARRVHELPKTYDSEEEAEEHEGVGFAGLLGRRWAGEPLDADQGGIPVGYEPDDHGEEVEMWMKIMKRTSRRLEVWDGDRDVEVYHARMYRPQFTETVVQEPLAPALTNGSRKKSRKVKSPSQSLLSRSRRGAPIVQTGQDLNDEITQDLLAERSDEDMEDDDSVGAEGEDNDASDMDMD